MGDNTAKKRVSIRKRMQMMVMIIILFSLMVVSAIGLYSMQRIKIKAQEVFLDRMEKNLVNTVVNKADIADAEFYRYIDYASSFAGFISELYQHPEKYSPKEVLPPDNSDVNVLTMKRYIASKDISYEDLKEENCLLGNVEYLFAPVANNNDEILAIYLSTESGLQISYDADSELTANKDNSEVYYNYFDRPWYQLVAKE